MQAKGNRNAQRPDVGGMAHELRREVMREYHETKYAPRSGMGMEWEVFGKNCGGMEEW